MIENEKSTVGYRIRRLTPKECWRLMGFSDESFERAQKALNDKFYGGSDRSASQLYKQAGNSIVTDVLFYIFYELYTAMPYLFDDLKVSSYFSGIGAFEIALDRLFDTINGQPEKVSLKSGGRNTIVYDDYNSRVRADQDTIGTLTTSIGTHALRSAYKLIEGENNE